MVETPRLLTWGQGMSRVPSSDIMLADQRQDPSSNARAASLSSEAVPTDLLTIRAPAPDWFRWAISHPRQSQFVMVAGCRIHYLRWARRAGEVGRARPTFRSWRRCT